jgi:uncharacterized protein
VEEPSGPPPIEGVPTAIAAFLGRTLEGPVGSAVEVGAFAAFEHVFGGLAAGFTLANAIRDFFRNGGRRAVVVRLVEPGGDASQPLSAETYLGDRAASTGLYALAEVDLFNILCVPPDPGGDTAPEVYRAAAEYCAARRAMLILDPPGAWGEALRAGKVGGIALGPLGAWPPHAARNAVIYVPRVAVSAPEPGGPTALPASGAVAGVWARTDAAAGVWRAPAGRDAALIRVALEPPPLTEPQLAALNRQGVNGLRALPEIGAVVWGARTLRGADSLADEYKYVPVRRTALFIEESVDRGTRWAAFEPNDERLWARLRLSVGIFLNDLFRQGAFQGATPRAAYFVKCDAETTTQADIHAGTVSIVVGFAPLKPAEFVVVKIGRLAGQPGHEDRD